MSGITPPTARQVLATVAVTTLLALAACSTAPSTPTGPGAWSVSDATAEATTTTTTTTTTVEPVVSATTTPSTLPEPALDLTSPTPEPLAAPRVAVALQTGPKLVVSPTGQLDPAGGTLSVGGTGYSPTKNNGFGVYVVFGPKTPNFWLDANLFLAAKWVHANPSPSPGQAKMNADGSFLVTLDVKSSYVDGNGATVDCLAASCHVMTFAAHGAPDRSFDVTSPVTFGRATTSTTAAPKSSTSTSTPGSPATAATSSGTGAASSTGPAAGSTASVAGVAESNSPVGTGTATATAPSSLAATGGTRTAVPIVAVLLLVSGLVMLVERRRRLAR